MGRSAAFSSVATKNRKLLAAALAVPVLVVVSTSADAATKYWDINGSGSGAGSATPAGNWNTTSTANWNTVADGSGSATTWSNGDTAVFAAGGDATGAYTVTINSPITVAGITREEGSPTLTGTSANTLSFTGGNLAVDTGSGTLIANVFYGTTNGVITKTGTGIFSSGTSQTAFAGKWVVNQGSLSVAGDTRLGVVPGSTVADQVTLNGGNIRSSTNNTVFTANRGITLGANGGGFDQTITMTWSGPITGTSGGALRIAATGTTILTNTGNNYDGGTTFTSGGTLQLGAAGVIPDTSLVTTTTSATFNLNGFDETIKSLAGTAGTVAVGTSNLILANPAGETFGGVITGTTGTVTKNGAGALTLTGANTFAGTTTISAGTLNIGAGGTTGSLASSIVNNAALVFNRSNTLTHAGAISGSGTVTKSGTSTLTLTGSNSYTGNTTVASGILVVGNANALGTTAGYTEVQSGGELQLTGAATTFTLAEPIRIAGAGGTAALNVQASATPTFSGQITLTADATVAVSSTAGAVFTNTNAFTATTQTLTLTGGSGAGAGGAISGNISLGSGSLNKTQGGKWVLSGTNTLTGATTISAGTLVINGTHTGSAVTVGNNATLGGSGVIDGSVTVSDGGTLAPGNSPGTITTGNLTLNATSNYAYQIDGTNNAVGGGVNDLTEVNGNLTLDGVANVSASPGLNGFGIRSYRMFNYTGTLNDNTMTVGTTPSSLYLYKVDTATAGQVNLEIQQKAKIGTVSSPAVTVIKGGVTPVSILVENSSPTGSANLSFSATNLGPGLFGAGAGNAAAQATGTGTISFDSTAVAGGTYTPGFTVTCDLATTQGGDVNGTTSITVLEHSNASFDGAGDKTLTVDFGTVTQGAGGGSLLDAFAIFNDLALLGFTAGLDLDTIVSSGDVGTLSVTGPVAFANMAAGSSQNYSVVFDTTSLGVFSATYTFKLSDQDMIGATAAGSDIITLTLSGKVVSAAVPLPASAWMGLGLLGGLGVVRRFRKSQPV